MEWRSGFVDELKIFKDFEIHGYNDKSESTGIGVRFLGTGAGSDTYEGVRFNNLFVRGLNTGFYLRTVRDIEISGCKIWAHYGIRNKGQVVVGRYHNNDIVVLFRAGLLTLYCRRQWWSCKGRRQLFCRVCVL